MNRTRPTNALNVPWKLTRAQLLAYERFSTKQRSERSKPTIARAVPAKNDLALGTASRPANPLNEERSAYVLRNIQTACPPRTAVPVNSGRTWEVVSLCSFRSELRSWMRLLQLCHARISSTRFQRKRVSPRFQSIDRAHGFSIGVMTIEAT